METVRIEAALRAVLPVGATVMVKLGRHAVEAKVGAAKLKACWVARGWPHEVARVLEQSAGNVDLIVAPQMSPGAKALAAQHGLGWLDETGAAEIASAGLVVSRSGQPAMRSPAIGSSWSPASMAVAEAVLMGTPPTGQAVMAVTGLSAGAVTNALRYFAELGFLESAVSRGPKSGRRLTRPEAFLASYAEAVEVRRTRLLSVVVGVLWTDPLTDVAAVGHSWSGSARRWALTGALAAAVLAPYLSEPAPLELFVTAASSADLVNAAREANLQPMPGGRLTIRAFPSAATAGMTQVIDGVPCVPWPRAFADLRTTGVRGEGAADHLAKKLMPMA